LSRGERTDFEQFMSLGVPTKVRTGQSDRMTFRDYSLGVSTNRDEVAYNFHRDVLGNQAKGFCEAFNNELDAMRGRNARRRLMTSLTTMHSSGVRRSKVYFARVRVRGSRPSASGKRFIDRSPVRTFTTARI